MSLNLALNNALSGLRLNQTAISTLSQNLANVNTDGYSRQFISQSAVYLGGVGNGVRIDSILRRVDNYLSRSVQSQGSELQRATVINDYHGRVQALIGQPGAGNSIDSTLTNFYNVLQQLADSPNSAASRSGVLSAAEGLSVQISDLAAGIEDLRLQSDRDIRASVDVANQQISRLFEINGAIGAAAVSNQSTAGLLDERDRALRSLAEQVDISVTYTQFGGVTVTAGNGVALVDDVPRQLTYTAATSLDVFLSDRSLSALNVVTLNENGVQTGTPTALIEAAPSADVNSLVKSGKIGGLLELRDTILPKMLNELDSLASGLRDAVNAVHNEGTAYPPPNSLTGTRAVRPGDAFEWSGNVRIAVLTAEGDPVPAYFNSEEYTGLRALDINLSALDSGNGEGRPTVQTIIDEINNHFRPPAAKVTLGDINNIQLVSGNKTLPTADSNFTFDLELENIADSTAQFFITDVEVLDDDAADITNVTTPAYAIGLSGVGTYTTTSGSGDVQIRLNDLPSGLKEGDTIYLSAPSVADINGIDPEALTGFLTIKSIDGDTVTVSTTGIATDDGVVEDSTPGTLQPPVKAEAGGITRTKENGAITINLADNPSAAYYDVKLTVAVMNADGSLRNSTITYRVLNQQQNLLNDRYTATDATDDAVTEQPNSTTVALRALLVDADGNEITKVNGKYVSQQGYLKLEAANGYSVVVDSLDSSQNGDSLETPPDSGTGRGFSHYFELNNFFASNIPSATGDTLRNSAYYMRLEDRLLEDPNLVATSQITQTRQPADPDAKPQYTYQLFSGDNRTANALANLRNATLSFEAAGDLPSSSVTSSVYTSYVLSSYSSLAQTSEDQFNTATTFYEEFKSQAESVSGVNIDEELANTVVFQNAYSATARVITVINQMFGDLLNSIGG